MIKSDLPRELVVLTNLKRSINIEYYTKSVMLGRAKLQLILIRRSFELENKKSPLARCAQGAMDGLEGYISSTKGNCSLTTTSPLCMAIASCDVSPLILGLYVFW